MKKFTDNEASYIIYGLVGVAIFVISLLIAIRIGHTLHDNIATVLSFLACNVLIWLLYLSFLHYIPNKLMDVFKKKAHSGISRQAAVLLLEERPLEDGKVDDGKVEDGMVVFPQQVESSADVTSADESNVDEPSEETHVESSADEPSEETHVESSADEPSEETQVELALKAINEPTPQLSQEVYDSYCTDYEHRRIAEKQSLIETILQYVNQSMAPFVDKDVLPSLCDEIKKWCVDPNYTPNTITMKDIPDARERLKTIDFKHFVWNIAVRLGFSNGYSCERQATFIKKLFPNELKKVETNSLASTLRQDSDYGKIKINEPLPESYEFLEE